MLLVNVTTSDESRILQHLTINKKLLTIVSQKRWQFQEQFRECKIQLLEEETQVDRETCRLQNELLQVKRIELNDLKREVRDLHQDIVELKNRYKLKSKTRERILSRDKVESTDKYLGKGAFGIVFEGRYCDCPVAVKRLKESTLTPQALSLCETEMEETSWCNFTCLLLFIGANQDENCLSFVPKLMDLSPRALLGKRQLSETEVFVLCSDVASALTYLHHREPTPIVHRDVSSANVLLWKQNDQWRGQLSDYGTAEISEEMAKYPGAVSFAAPELRSSSDQTRKVNHPSYQCS